jgi:rhodanese-related sulfurtransferase
VSVAEAAAQRDAGAFILDVREPDEWADFHVPGSTHIPLAQVAARVAELPRDQAIIVVCRSGNRSQQGRDLLRDAGFEQVSSMAGGLKEWVALGYPTVSGP